MFTRARRIVLCVTCGLLASAGSASAALYGVQPDTGQIVEVNPATGVIVRSFAAPDSISTVVGLSGAEDGATLLWQDSLGETTEDRITRINPLTGSILSYHMPLYVSGEIRGLTEQDVGGVPYITSGVKGELPIVQHGYESTQYTRVSLGADLRTLGGDDHGRSFAACFDQTIREFDPISGNELNSFTFDPPVTGLAFDGRFLYAAANANDGQNLFTQLYTLDPDTGAVLNEADVQGAPLSELGVAVPEPHGIYLAVLGACAAMLLKR